jgi:hypothetical protein
MGSPDRAAYDGVWQEIQFPTNFRAVLTWGSKFAAVQVADIANCGLRVIGDCLPETHTRVRIGARGLNGHGVALWRTPNSCGIRLDERIEALRVVRCNAAPANREVARDEQLDAIRREKLAEQLLDLFQTIDGAKAFLRDDPRGMERH